MKKIFLGLLIITLFLLGDLFASPVDLEMATQVANMKITIKGKTDYTVDDVFKLKDENGTILSYVFSLSPKGYIAISTDTDITPVITYSFRNDFVAEDIPQNIGYQMLKRDMQLRLEAIPLTSEEIKSKNNLSWTNYEKGNAGFFQTKGREIWPAPGTTPTGGWIETQWNQNPSPYWDYCPLDPEHGGKCVVGCVATAMAQIVNYHRYIDDVSFDDSDDYWSTYTTPNIHIDDDWNSYDFPSFPTLNTYLDDLRACYMTNDDITNDMIAALSFACGVSTHMQYSANGSGTQLSEIATALLGKFGYDSATHYYSSHPQFYNYLKGDMMGGRPAALGISGGGGAGHAIDCDGYDSGGDTYHLNMGWGGYQDGWYSLPSGMPSGFNVVDHAVMNIEGGELPFLEIDSYFVAELTGDFDGNVNPGESITLRIRLSNRESFATATDIVGILHCDDPRATITDSIGTWNDIAAGSSGLNLLDPVSIDFDDGIGVCTIDFTLQVTSNIVYSADLDLSIDVVLDQAGWPIEIINGILGCPALVDINNNGETDVIFGDKNGNVHCCDNSGNEFTGFPFNTGGQIYGSVAITDINGDGELNIVVGSRSNDINVLKPNGDELFSFTTPGDILCTPVISDIDNNGSYEIIFQTAYKDLYVIDSSGANYPNFPVTLPGAMYMNVGVAVADINGDNLKEILVGCSDGNVYCINTSAETIWTAETSGAIRSSPTIVKFEEDYKIVAGTSTGKVYIISSDGVVENEITLSGEIRTSPIIVNLDDSDINGFDDLEIVVGTMTGKLYVVDWAGNILSGFPYNTGTAIESTPIIADINDDGLFDIIFGCNDKNLYAIASNGGIVTDFPIYCSYDIKSPPSIADIDEDGDYEIAFGTINGLCIIDYKPAYSDSSIMWPMYRYNLERTGLVDWTQPSGIDNSYSQYRYFIEQNFPNPVKTSTTISFSLATNKHEQARIKIYNARGQLVKKCNVQNAKCGLNEIIWNGKDSNDNKVANGIYLYRLETDDYKSEIKKMILLR
ncbi:MAG: C10 family peptidase [Candidatus Cloacimonadota bacterium]|nr:C10 family peptidase [Candidatus Cloacimonadota bacterium]